MIVSHQRVPTADRVMFLDYPKEIPKIKNIKEKSINESEEKWKRKDTSLL